MPFPKDIEYAKKRPVAILLKQGEFMVCLQAESKTEVGLAHGGNGKETLAACEAYCVKADWVGCFCNCDGTAQGREGESSNNCGLHYVREF